MHLQHKCSIAVLFGILFFAVTCDAQQIIFEPAGGAYSSPKADEARVIATPTPREAGLFSEVSPHGTPYRFYAGFEYLLFDFSRDIAPPLVTTGPNSSSGSLGEEGVVVLYVVRLDQDLFSAGRLTLGAWLDCRECKAVELSFFATGEEKTRFFASSPGDPSLFRPFLRINAFGPPSEDTELVAKPGILSGSVEVCKTAQLLGADLRLRQLLCSSCSCCSTRHWYLDAFFGIKYLQLTEQLRITEDLLTLPGIIQPDVRFQVVDHFDTQNNFLGVNLGLQCEVNWGSLFIQAHGSIALGGTNQNVDIHGTTTITFPGGDPTNLIGGLYALPTNIGSTSRTVFSTVPQLGLLLGAQLSDHFRLFLGYDAYCWTNVIRPAEQIDRAINVSQLPTTNGPGTLVGPARPSLTFNSSTLWIQSLSAGLEFRF